MVSYKVLDHDADIHLEVYGASLEELFQNAAMALFSFITDLEKITPSLVRESTVTGNGELLVNFLNDLLYLWDTERFIPADVSVAFGDQGLAATMRGETFNTGRHIIKQEMKAVTYHKFSIVEKGGIFTASLIIDV